MRNAADLRNEKKELVQKLLAHLKRSTWMLKTKDITAVRMFAEELAAAIMKEENGPRT